ncbi:hypothetical protein [Actinomadura mexicana]|nr:hypothetical protein [Actinomadura mexicana]
MGAWVHIRGRLEFHGQRAEAELIIDRGDPAGWAFRIIQPVVLASAG